MSAYDILKARGVSRLCHFTTLRSLTHILSSGDGVLATGSIRSDTKNVIDKARYDGELDYVCCSVEYPNSWFLKNATINNTDKVFRDWLVLYINLDILNLREAKFCPCNASIGRGRHITDDVNALFADPVCCKKKFCREPNMLSCCPTDGQAEILIKSNIPRDCVTGIAVGTEEIGRQIYSIIKTYCIRQIPLYAAPDVLTSSWSGMIRSGQKPSETNLVWPEEE
ncbi:MAG: DUF4433 domain-containing protein [Peptococcaceae bacterium]|jgi:hypothetical protein|nr:DUF4433 domain-containing protein [Peptococcaceae bacterium]